MRSGQKSASHADGGLTEPPNPIRASRRIRPERPSRIAAAPAAKNRRLDVASARHTDIFTTESVLHDPTNQRSNSFPDRH